jgi:hypothetical protein
MSSYLHTGYAEGERGCEPQGREIRQKTRDFPRAGQLLRRFPRLAPILYDRSMDLWL